jgi:hypothetical protein
MLYLYNRRNYVSNTVDIPWNQDLPGARDDHASGFRQYNGPNDYVRNLAVGNEGDGFHFVNDYRLKMEVRRISVLYLAHKFLSHALWKSE